MTRSWLAALRPDGRRAGVVAALAAFAFAAAGAAAGSWLGWRDAGPLPTDAQARAMVSQLAPDLPVSKTERSDVLFAYEDPAGSAGWFLGGDDYNAGFVQVTARPAGGDFHARFTALRDSLPAHGWEVTGVDEPDLQASRDGLVLIVSAAWDDGSIRSLRGVRRRAHRAAGPGSPDHPSRMMPTGRTGTRLNR
ncbi:hypothetical protein [Actinoplanes sp. NPDC026623]|uniref:hypothetical protein n=1 Tax=Actinoplanes sp. NPDC026623 TaxID=3155610 RepID=UPI0033C0F978